MSEQPLREMERLLVQLHELIATDRTDSDRAEEIRDKMDQLSASLTASEIRIVGELSGDLYMLTGEEVEAEAMRGKNLPRSATRLFRHSASNAGPRSLARSGALGCSRSTASLTRAGGRAWASTSRP